jgi:N-acetylmuramoyl-L-alanine amidase
MKCLLSAGHGPKRSGGYDPGATVWDPLPSEPGAVLREEHELAIQIVREIAHELRDVPVVLVPSDTLSGKIRFVNRWSRPGDLAIEIHLNWASSSTARGAETFFASGSDRGRHLASILHAALVRIGRPARGAKPDTQSSHKRLAWCRRTKPWAVIVEVGFLTNEADLDWIVTRGGIGESARALASAVDSWG